MQSQNWGPHAWNFLHSVSFAYPIEPTLQDQQNYKNFYHSIQFILPCSFCRSYYCVLLKYILIIILILVMVFFLDLYQRFVHSELYYT